MSDKSIPLALRYESSAEKISFDVHLDGSPTAPDAAPTITIYDPAGTELLAATNMTIKTADREGMLKYDAQTAEFQDGDKVTGGTSANSGQIVAQDRQGASGTLWLSSVDGGVFTDNETITGALGGSADADGTLFLTEYDYWLDCSSTTNYPVDANYVAQVDYDISSKAYRHYIYFDVAYYPMTEPIVTTSDVVMQYPQLLGAKPDSWPDFSPAIQRAHADLVRRIHRYGEQAAHYVKRASDFFAIEMSFVWHQICVSLGMPLEMQDRARKDRESEWSSRGVMLKDDDDDVEVDSAQNYIRLKRER